MDSAGLWFARKENLSILPTAFMTWMDKSEVLGIRRDVAVIVIP